jgi:hypothetical protein
MSTFQKKIAGEIFFRVEFFLGDFFLTPFPFDFFVALVKRLSVRGPLKNVIKKFYGVVRLIFFPLTDFFLGRFWAFLDEGNSKTRLKKTRHRTCTKVQSWPNKVPTYIGCFFFNFVSAAPCYALSTASKKSSVAPSEYERSPKIPV